MRVCRSSARCKQGLPFNLPPTIGDPTCAPRALHRRCNARTFRTAVNRALSGVDVVTQSLGVSAGPEIIFKPTRFFSKATRVLVTAMEEAQVKRLICVTGFGAGNSRGHGGFLYCAAFHLLLARVYDDKDVQERIVRRSKLDWVIVRPVILTDGPKTNAYRALVDPRRWTCGFISRADVADFLVKQIGDDAFLHKTPVLTS